MQRGIKPLKPFSLCWAALCLGFPTLPQLQSKPHSPGVSPGCPSLAVLSQPFASTHGVPQFAPCDGKQSCHKSPKSSRGESSWEDVCSPAQRGQAAEPSHRTGGGDAPCSQGPDLKSYSVGATGTSPVQTLPAQRCCPSKLLPTVPRRIWPRAASGDGAAPTQPPPRHAQEG